MKVCIIAIAALAILLVIAVVIIRYQRMMVLDLRYQLAEERKWMDPVLVKELDDGFPQ